MGKTARKRVEEYIEELAAAFGHADRDEPSRHYTTGLLLPLERKSVEPIAGKTPRFCLRHQKSVCLPSD